MNLSSQPESQLDNDKEAEITPMQEALKLYMSVKGVTARGMGRSLRIDHTAISRFISGKNISLQNYTKILAWFVQVPDYPPSIKEEV